MNSGDLILLGAGRFGREVEAWIRHAGHGSRIRGFLDDEKNERDILGPIASHQPYPGLKYLTCLGNGSSRHAIRTRLSKLGARFDTFIGPQVVTVSTLDDSRNSIFLGSCSISSTVVLGDDLLIQGFACVGHDVTIGDGATISSHAFIGGGAILGRFATIHPHAIILPDISIGEGAVIGAGSVVIRNVPAYTTVFGSPAKTIAYGKPNE